MWAGSDREVKVGNSNFHKHSIESLQRYDLCVSTRSCFILTKTMSVLEHTSRILRCSGSYQWKTAQTHLPECKRMVSTSDVIGINFENPRVWILRICLARYIFHPTTEAGQSFSWKLCRLWTAAYLYEEFFRKIIITSNIEVVLFPRSIYFEWYWTLPTHNC